MAEKAAAVRPARPEDRPALIELYNHYVRETPITFDTEPYTVESRRPWFEQFAEAGPYRLLVAEEAGRLLGYAASMRYRPKAAYRTSVETSVYVAADEGGRGLGTLLYDALFRTVRGEALHLALAGVTLPNPASIALHRRFGFTSVGVQHEVGFKLGRYWDVEWFEKTLE
jgi:phosphinothricin acetyltransferase